MNDNGASEKWASLIDDYGGLVYAIVLNKLNRCGTKEDIEDCVSDIFVEVYRSLPGYDPEKGDMKVFVSSIAKRRAIDAFRRLSYRMNVTDHIDDEQIPPIHSPEDTAEEAEKRILRKKLWETVKALGEPDSTIILYQYFYNMRSKEIAKRLSMSTAAVMKRSLRARAKIREMLEKE